MANNHNIMGYKRIKNGKICQKVGWTRSFKKKRGDNHKRARDVSVQFISQPVTKNRFINVLMFTFSIRLIFTIAITISINANVSNSVLLPENVSCSVWFDGKSMYAMLRKLDEKKKLLPAFRIVHTHSFFIVVFRYSMVSVFRNCTVRLQNMQSLMLYIGEAVQIRIEKNHFNLLHISWFYWYDSLLHCISVSLLL